ncbi:hypothetical protein [Parabacteroides distasonis]|uniref:hypothetical protein n=1 Tax=Parabacteroides distasonis TaxID=823 RepID=UPI0011C16810|nr:MULTISPECIES: hypothetical protein [Parabacteroides]
MRLGGAIVLLSGKFHYLCSTKTEGGAFGYGRCHDIEDSYPAWKQAGVDIHIVRSLNVSVRKLALFKRNGMDSAMFMLYAYMAWACLFRFLGMPVPRTGIV